MNQVPWGRRGNQLFFDKDGQGPARNSIEYDDFVLFFTRYRESKPVERMTDAYLLDGLKYFRAYQSQKTKALEAKIVKEQNELPVKAYESQIVDAIKNNRVVLIAADTGAGKSTQVPQYLLKAGFENICITQPRRIACFSLAKRVSYETLNMYGTEIGYQVRFDSSKSANTKATFVTEGLLLRQFSADPYLKQYNIIIIDEVHERHITGDFLMGIMKRILEYRLDIRLVLMSATINADLFSSYFNAPMIEIPGRMFSVKIEYHPVEDEDTNLTSPQFMYERSLMKVKQSIKSRGSRIKAGPYLKILESIDKRIGLDERGDLLIFVPGINEITLLADELRTYASFNRRWIILELHSSLSINAQEKVFDVAPLGVRKCIISTNIAETSVTIDGIRFIIDSGKVKEMAFHSQTSVSKLSEFWISKSSAKQRAGRAGRTGPGEEYEAFNDFPVPEILRMPLDSIVLDIAKLQLGDPLEFEFVENPSTKSIADAVTKMISLGCLGDDYSITNLGKVISALPVDATLGKMLVLGSISQLLGPILSMTGVLSIQSPFTRIPHGVTNVMENRKSLTSTHGDAFTLINLFMEWLEVKAENKESSSKWCKQRGVEEQRLYEIVKLKSQFFKTLQDCTSLVPKTLNDVEADEVKDREFRIARRKLEKRKMLATGRKRKYLKIDSGSDSNEEEETIAEAEFKLNNDAEELLLESDINFLSKNDLTVLKLIMVAGLYPNIAIPDPFNSNRPALEHVFHTKAKRFVNVLPHSVFTQNPELLNQDKLSGKSDLLFFVGVLETKKPYLVNPCRVEALSLAILFAKRLDLSHDFQVMVMDEWLEFRFENTSKIEKVLLKGFKIRYSWQKAVEDAISEEDSLKEKYHPDLNLLENLHYIPNTVKSLRKDWLKSTTTVFEIGDIMDELSKFVDMDCTYSCQKLKLSNVEESCGFSLGTELGTVRITPHLHYHVNNLDFNHIDQSRFVLPKAMGKMDDPQKLSSRLISSTETEGSERTLFICESCHRRFLFTAGDTQRHLSICAL